jgi:hypothetical protein
MFIAIVHDIHDPTTFQQRAEQVFPLPEGLHVHKFFPSTKLDQAVCLYEAPSVDQLREYLDGTLGDASTQRYFPVAEDHSIGMPARQLP